MDMAAPTKHCGPEVAEVIRDEFWMFHHLYNRLWLACRESEAFSPGVIVLKGTGAGGSTWEVSAELESYLLHTRVLRDFFYKTTRRESDDVLAEDFIPGWRGICPALGVYLRDNKKRLE